MECCEVLWSIVECNGVLWSVIECYGVLWSVIQSRILLLVFSLLTSILSASSSYLLIYTFTKMTMSSKPLQLY